MTLYGAALGADFRVGFGACTGTLLPAQPLPDWATT
jgi:fumarylacetoacetase